MVDFSKSIVGGRANVAGVEDHRGAGQRLALRTGNDARDRAGSCGLRKGDGRYGQGANEPTAGRQVCGSAGVLDIKGGFKKRPQSP